MKKYLKYLFLIVTLVLLSSCSQKPIRNSNKVSVISSVSTYQNIAANIVGSHGSSSAVIKSSSVDPHDFTPDTRTAKEVADADVVIANGQGYDDWIKKLKDHNQLINVSKQVNIRNGENEHAWYKMSYMKQLVKKITKTVSKLDNKHQNYYQKNSQKYLLQLDNLSNQEKEIKKTSKNKSAYISEPVVQYLLDDVGIKVKNKRFAKAIEDGTDPSISDTEKVEKGLKNRDVDFIVINKQSESNIIDKLKKNALKNNIPIIYVTETLPAGSTYIDWMQGYLNRIKKVIGNDNK